MPEPDNYIGREMVMTEDALFFGSSRQAAYVFDIEAHWATFCEATPNATGGVGRIEVGGSASLAANNLQLTAAGLTPQQFGFFLVGDASDPPGVIPPGSVGRLCLAGSIGRYLGPGQIQNTGGAGTMSIAVDLRAIPGPTGSIASMVGSIWQFQAWHRDIGTQPTSNLTQALSVTVQ